MAIGAWGPTGALLLASAFTPGLWAQDGETIEEDNTRPLEMIHRPSATVNGTVQLDSGMPPPEPIAVEILCESSLLSQVFTDRKGRFTAVLDPASNSGMLDASAANQAPNPAMVDGWMSDSRSFRQCQVRIILAGYRPELFDLSDEGSLGITDVGTIVLRRLDGTQGAAVSVTSYEAPKAAQKLFEAAFRDAHRKKANLEGAIKKLKSAVEIYPRYAAAWDLLGDCHWVSGSLDLAREAYEAALAADKDYLPPYGPLIRLAVHTGRWADVDRLAEERLRLAPGVEAAYFRALALFQLGSIEAAERAIEVAVRSRDAGRFPQIALVQADIHEMRGRYKQAAAQYALYLSQAPQSPARPEIEAKLAGWQQAGKLATD